jgi:CheY-like chemotaxis protein
MRGSDTGNTVLAVDDDQDVLRLLDSALQAAGYRVIVADCGWNAIQAYEKSACPIDLLLTDDIMPDLTGPVVAERLRSRQPDL